MTRIDNLKKKAKQTRPDRVPNHTRAVSAYFDMVSYCYNAGGGDLDSDIVPDVPEIDRPEFWDLFDRLDLKCTRDEMRAWIDRPDVEDHILPHRDESLVKLDEYLAERRERKTGE